MLDPEVTFLNHGSFGATPRVVFDEYQRWQRELERQPVEFIGRRGPALLAEARQVLAEYVNAGPDDLVYVTNTTTALNIVARSLNLVPGDQVLTSDLEYGAMDRTWAYLAARQGFAYIRQPTRLPLTTHQAFADELWAAVTSQTRVIFLSHITSATALTLPVLEICRRARQAGILTVIDGAHVPGQLPLDLRGLDADFYAGNLHKWLCAPKGSAFLYAHPRVQHLIEPLIVSWGWQSETPGASTFIDLLEYAGTRDYAAFLSVPAAIHFQREHHWDAVRQSCHALAREARLRFAELTGVQPLHPDSSDWHMQMAALPLPSGLDAARLKSWLYDEHKIEIPNTSLGGRHFLRISIQGYNRPADVEKLLTATQRCLGGGG